MHGVRVPARAMALGLLLAVTGAATAQQAPPATGAGEQDTGTDNEVLEFAEFERPRRMIFLFSASEDEFSPMDRFVLYSSVLMAVGDVNPNVVVLESPDTEVPDTSLGRQELARLIDADAWLLVDATGGMDDIRIEVETFDILRQQVFGSEVIQPGFRLDYRALSRGFWDSLAETISTEYESVADTLEVAVTARPGTRLTGLASRTLDVGDTGVLRMTLPNPATYTLEAHALGMYPVQRTFYLGYQPLELELEQTRAALYAVDGFLNNLQFVGARFWYFFIPATFYVQGGFTSYALGLYLVDSSPSVFGGSPLTNLTLGSGWYLTEPGRDMRFYVGAGLFLRIVHAAELVGIEPTAPAGAELLLGAEYSPWLGVKFFVEYAPQVYYTADELGFRLRTFPPSLYPDGNVPGWMFTEVAAIDFRHVTTGVRISW